MVIITSIFVSLLVIAGLQICFKRNYVLRPFDKVTTDSLRGILALLIVFHHISLRTEIPLVGEFGKSAGIPLTALFFLLSGYGLGISYLHKGKKYLDKFFSRRYSKILPPFLLLTLIAVFLRVLLGKALYNQANELVLQGNPPLPNSWFIYAIIYTYAAFYVSAILGKNPKRTGLYLIGFNYIYIYITSTVGQYGFWWFVTIPSVNFGYYIAIHEKSISESIRLHPIAVYLTAIIMVMATAYGINKIPGLANTTGLLLNGLWALTIAGAGYLIIRSLGLIQWNPLIWCSAISMEIYLIHSLPVLYLQSIFTGMNDLIYIFLVYTLSIFSAWLIHKIINIRSVYFKKFTYLKWPLQRK